MRSTSEAETVIEVSINDSVRRSPNFDEKWVKEACAAMLNSAGVPGRYTLRVSEGIHGSPGRSKTVRFSVKQHSGRPVVSLSWQSGHNGTAFAGILTSPSIEAVDLHRELSGHHRGGVFTYQPGERVKSFSPDAALVSEIALELCALAGSRADRAVELTGVDRLLTNILPDDTDRAGLLRWLIAAGYALPVSDPKLFAYIEPALFKVVDPSYNTSPSPPVEKAAVKPTIGAIGLLQELKGLREKAEIHREAQERIDVITERQRTGREVVARLKAERADLDRRIIEAERAEKAADVEIRKHQETLKDPDLVAAVEALAEFEALFRAGR